jgi:hypothetical protein
MYWRKFVAACAVAALLSPAVALGAAKTYQVTGPVLELNADAIVVKKGADRWEIARDAGSTVPADLKVGDNVTIMYRMTAVTVTPKAATAAKKAAPKKAAKPKA